MKETEYATDIRVSRRNDTNEFFTPTDLVNRMLDKLPEDSWPDLTRTYIDPAAGNFNFLVEVLRRKLRFCETPEDVYTLFSNIYATEIMKDNVDEGKERMISMFSENSVIKADVEKIREIMNRNLVCVSFYDWDYENWRRLPDYKSNMLFDD